MTFMRNAKRIYMIGRDLDFSEGTSIQRAVQDSGASGKQMQHVM